MRIRPLSGHSNIFVVLDRISETNLATKGISNMGMAKIIYIQNFGALD
jgi:hypothetical protein